MSTREYADRIVISWTWPEGYTNAPGLHTYYADVYRSISTNHDGEVDVSDKTLSSEFVDSGRYYGIWPHTKYYYWVKLTIVYTNLPLTAIVSDYSSCAVGYAGLPRNIAAPADYDGDGLVDLATCQESTGNWQFLLSSSGYTQPLIKTGFLGGDGFVPVTMDYDNDGKADPAVYNEETGVWSIRLSGSDYYQVNMTIGN